MQIFQGQAVSERQSQDWNPVYLFAELSFSTLGGRMTQWLPTTTKANAYIMLTMWQAWFLALSTC